MDEDFLAKAVGRALGAGRPADLEEVDEQSIPYDVFLVGRRVSRITGTARLGGERRRWSLVRKATDGPDAASPYLLDNARRELHAYRSGLLDRLPRGIGAPRPFDARDTPDGGVDLLLEDLTGARHGGWTPDEVLVAARALGRLGGTAILDAPWLFHGWRTRHSQPEAIVAGRALIERRADDPLVVGRFGRPAVRAALELVDAQPRIVDLLGRLPQVLCHHDAQLSNVYLRAGDGATETVLIDWESVGPGAVGADLASLLFASVRRGDLAAGVMRALLPDALEAYRGGLREGGDDEAAAQARRGLFASIALRWTLARDVFEALGTDTRTLRGRASEDRAEGLDELSGLLNVLLDVATEVD